jgi:hypothetical protein
MPSNVLFSSALAAVGAAPRFKMKFENFGALLLALATTATLFATHAQAVPVRVPGQGTWQTTLQARDLDGNGTTDAFYDTDLKITWLSNANVNANPTDGGLMTWTRATAWAGALKVGTFDDWRLPTMVDTGKSGCDFSYTGGTDCGYNVQTDTSEMAHLFYVTLGNKASCAPVDQRCNAHPSGGSLKNSGDFQNLQAYYYWSSLTFAPDTSNAWDFDFGYGLQSTDRKVSKNFYAMAVRPGDVLAAEVPEPGTLLLAAAALASLGVARRRLALAA